MQRVLSAAGALLKTRCMNAAGFRFYPGVPDTPSPLYAKISLYSFSGRPPSERSDLAARARFGYGLFDTYTPAGELAASGGPNAERDTAYIATLTPRQRNRYSTALFGPNSAPEGTVKYGGMVLTYGTVGCQARADATIYGSVRAALRVLLVGQSLYASLAKQTDAATRASLAAWSKCLDAATGRYFASANAPIAYMQQLYAQRGPTPAMHAYERALATKDGRCQYQSGLAENYAAAFRRLSNGLPVSAVRAIAQSLAVDRAGLARARRFLSHGPQLAALNGGPGALPPVPKPGQQGTAPIPIGAPGSARRR
jgi:hypothetical protein